MFLPSSFPERIKNDKRNVVFKTRQKCKYLDGSDPLCAMKLDLLCHLWTILLVHNMISVKTKPLANNFKSNKRLRNQRLTSQSYVNVQGNGFHSLSQKENKGLKTRLRRNITDMLETGTTELDLGDKSTTHTESSSNSNYGLDVSEDLPNDDRIEWKGFSMHSNHATSKANPVDKDNGKEVSRTNANVDRNVQKANKDQANVLLQLVMSTSIPGENPMLEHTPRLMFPFKKNPQPQQVGKEIELKTNIVTLKFENVNIRKYDMKRF